MKVMKHKDIFNNVHQIMYLQPQQGIPNKPLHFLPSLIPFSVFCF